MADVLIIDDSKIARKFLKNVLAENGHRIVGEGTNGEEGYELFTKLMPDVVLCDITMPVLDGIECLKKILDEFPKAKVIMVSSLGKESKIEQAKQLGAHGFIIKPLNPEEIAELVEECVSGGK